MDNVLSKGNGLVESHLLCLVIVIIFHGLISRENQEQLASSNFNLNDNNSAQIDCVTTEIVGKCVHLPITITAAFRYE